MNQIGIAAVLVVAVGAALWFRRKPLSQTQRFVFAGVAIALLALNFLWETPLEPGKVALVVLGSAVLLLAVRFLGSSDREPE